MVSCGIQSSKGKIKQKQHACVGGVSVFKVTGPRSHTMLQINFHFKKAALLVHLLL